MSKPSQYRFVASTIHAMSLPEIIQRALHVGAKVIKRSEKTISLSYQNVRKRLKITSVRKKAIVHYLNELGIPADRFLS